MQLLSQVCDFWPCSTPSTIVTKPLGEMVTYATISPARVHTSNKCSVTPHSGNSVPTSGISILTVCHIIKIIIAESNPDSWLDSLGSG